MREQVVQHDLEIVKADTRRAEKDDSIRKVMASKIAPKVKAADSAHTIHVAENTRLTIADSTHITVHRTPSLHDTVAVHDTTVQVPSEITDRLQKMEADYIREHDLRLDLQAQVRVDSTVIADQNAVISDQKVTISDLQKLKNRPGVLTAAATGAGTGAVVGAAVGGAPGAAIGAGVGLIVNTGIHVIFFR